jgi:hypothetical protein
LLGRLGADFDESLISSVSSFTVLVLISAGDGLDALDSSLSPGAIKSVHPDTEKMTTKAKLINVFMTFFPYFSLKKLNYK